METYTLLLSEEPKGPVLGPGPELAKILDLPPAEVTRRLRDAPWIVAESVSAAALDDVFAVLSAAGLSGKAIPDTYMPALPRALRVRNADVMPLGLFLTTAEPPSPPFVSWPDLWIVSAGSVTVLPEEAHRHHAWDDAAPAGRKKAEDHLLVDLLFRGGDEWRFRIDAGDFSYDFLKERMQPSSRENLKALLYMVRERAPKALFTARTLAFLGGEPSPAYRFRSLAGFESHNLWVRQAAEESEQ